jgi:hypothetical protein
VSRSRCRRHREVALYLDGELPTDAAFQFEEHLVECALCCDAVDSQRELEEALSRLPTPSAQAGDRRRLLDRIESATHELPRLDDLRSDAEEDRRRVAWRRVAAAAVVLLATSAALWVFAHRRSLVTPTPRDATAAVPAAPSPTVSVPIAVQEAEIGDTRPPLDLVRLLAARDEVVRVLRGLSSNYVAIADGDVVSRFLAAVQPLRAAGVPLPPLMLQLLRDPDADVACRAADLFARAVRAGDLGPDDLALVPALEAAMRRPDRGAAMVETLVAVGSRRAWLAVESATELETVRAPALRALAKYGDSSVLATLERRLLECVNERHEPRAVADALARLRVARPEHLALLASLARGGVDAAPIADALARGRDGSTLLVARALDERSTRRDALLLAPLCRDAAGSTALVDALARLVARKEDAAPALEALGRVGGARVLTTLAWLEEGRALLSNARARQVVAAFDAALLATPDLRRELAEARASLPAALAPQLVELVSQARGPAQVDAHLALLADEGLASALRGRVALELANRRERVAVAPLLRLLGDVAAARAPDVGDDGLTSSLLALLVAVDGRDGLLAGARTLGVEVAPPQQERLLAAARALARGPLERRETERLCALLQIAP